jgi:hypothetical protein
MVRNIVTRTLKEKRYCSPGDHPGHSQYENYGKSHTYSSFHFFGRSEKRTGTQVLGQDDVVNEYTANYKEYIIAHDFLLNLKAYFFPMKFITQSISPSPINAPGASSIKANGSNEGPVTSIPSKVPLPNNSLTAPNEALMPR